MRYPLEYLSETDEDKMYFHQATQKIEKEESSRATVKSINNYCDKEDWNLIPKEDIP